jgi:hypothetical protein
MIVTLWVTFGGQLADAARFQARHAHRMLVEVHTACIDDWLQKEDYPEMPDFLDRRKRGD